MAFKVLFMAHSPDADPDKHNWILETDMYKLFVVFVKNQNQAIEISKKLAEDENIDSILLCPGFTHKDVAEIVDATGGKVAVSVARGDGPSSRISAEARRREGWTK